MKYSHLSVLSFLTVILILSPSLTQAQLAPRLNIPRSMQKSVVEKETNQNLPSLAEPDFQKIIVQSSDDSQPAAISEMHLPDQSDRCQNFERQKGDPLQQVTYYTVTDEEPSTTCKFSVTPFEKIASIGNDPGLAASAGMAFVVRRDHPKAELLCNAVATAGSNPILITVQYVEPQSYVREVCAIERFFYTPSQ